MGEFMHHEACPKCREEGNDKTGNNLSVYTDGVFCERCKTSTRPPGTKFYYGAAKDLPSRGLKKESFEKLDVQFFEYTGKLGKTHVTNEPCMGFNIYDNGQLVKQKIRSIEDKHKCTQIGDTKNTKLFGMHKFTPSKKIAVVLTEGEPDAVAMAQCIVQPAVSIGGASGAKKAIESNIDWLSGWSHVVLCFDNDEVGKKAVQECIGEFEVGSVRVAHLPLKDANDMVKAHREKELQRCIWNAEIIRPDSIVRMNDPKLIEQVLVKPKPGIPWAFESMNKITHGMLPGMYVLGAGEGIGKTEFIKELIFDFVDKKMRCGLFSFEQNPVETSHRLIGARCGHRLHIPSQTWWEPDEIRKSALELGEYIDLYDTKGRVTLSLIINNIRYLNKANGIKFFVIDNLTALSLFREKGVSELEFMNECAGEFNAIWRELNICVMVIVHLNEDKYSKSTYVGRKKNTDELNTEGLTWETGRIPDGSNIRNGNQLRSLASYVIMLARNRKSQSDSVRRLMTVKFTKTRLDEETGLDTFYLLYNKNTGRLEETSNSCYNSQTNNVM